jgi:DNA-binding CsgD family transcriptional regulator
MPLFKFVAQAHTISDMPHLFQELCQFLRPYGYEHCGFVLLASQLRSASKDSWPCFVSFPENWTREYIKQGYRATDPIMRRALSAPGPFDWYDMEGFGALTPAEANHLALLRERGFTGGIAVPVFSPRHTAGILFAATSDGSPSPSEADLTAITGAAQLFLRRYMEANDPWHDDGAALTQRERDVLTWIARGKSNSVIAEILGISENTVETLVGRCYRKLGVSDRVSAAVKGIGAGLVKL